MKSSWNIHFHCYMSKCIKVLRSVVVISKLLLTNWFLVEHSHGLWIILRINWIFYLLITRLIIFRCMQGCKPAEPMEVMGGSAAASPCSSYHPSPCASYNPSPGSSSFPSPASSSYVANPNADGNSLIPWLKNLSSASSSASSSKLPHLYIHSGSISAPVTPPLSSPTARTPRIKTDWDENSTRPTWGGQHSSILPSSTPPSPGRLVVDPEWFAGIRLPHGAPTSPTFSLVSTNPFGFKEDVMAGGGSRMWTPGQSGTCSPAIAAGSDHTADIPMAEVISDEFAFGSHATGLVKPWEGERIHEECGSDDLELTLGSSRTRFVGIKIGVPTLIEYVATY